MRSFRRGRPLKRWRYVGAYAEDVMVCVCEIRLGPIPQRFWAVAERGRPIVTCTTTRAGGVSMQGSRASVAAPGVRIELEVEEAGGVETVHPSGGLADAVWTRKQAGVPVRGFVELGERRHEIDALGVVDDTAGHHRRRTEWRWCAGAGRLADGRAVGWNLVTGVNDAETGSERAIWLDGSPFEPAPVAIAPDLSSVRFAGGEELRFAPWAERAARTNLLVVRSSYRQPFGEFSGNLPGGVSLEEGRGVMEWHDVRW